LLADLPPVFHRLLPELEQVPLAVETLADCKNCPIRASEWPPSSPTPRFHPDLVCCGYQPRLPNYVVGRILRDGGEGARRVTARMREGEGVTSWGIFPSEAWEALARHPETDFGVSLDLRCPYLLPGASGCSIWPHREAVCRTWFCRHTQGSLSIDRWYALQDVLWMAQSRLMAWCVGTGVPPRPWAPLEELEAWFLWCARALDDLEGAPLERLRDAELEAALAVLLAVPSEPPPLPDVVCPAISEFHRDGEVVVFRGYSVYDTVTTDMRIFRFLSLLDGERSWRDALAQANRQLDEPLQEGIVHELYRIGALDPDPEGALQARAEMDSPSRGRGRP